MNYYTYIYIDPITNIPRYVGYGHGNRAYSHLIKSHNKSFAGWIHNLKEKGFTPIIIKEDVRSKEEAKILEIFWISIYGRLDNKTGCLFNHTAGGDGGSGRIFSHTEETKKKMSETRKGRIGPMTGKSHSDETKKKMSEVRKGEGNSFYGKSHSEETKRLHSETMKGRLVGANNPFFGKRHSKEVLDSIANKNRGRKHTEEARKKISEANRTRIRKPKTEDSKKKISDSAKLDYKDK